MNILDSPAAADTRSTVEALTQQREQLRGWLARLDEVGRGVAGHVAERVRADYQARLQVVTQELSSHQDAIRADLDTQRTELEHAESMRAEAADEMDEVHLRHLIGELPQETWEERRPHLEGAVAAAEGEVTRIRAEVERLDTLLREMGQGNAPAAGPPAGVEQPAVDEPAAEPPRAAIEPDPDATQEAPEAPAARTEDTVPEYTPPVSAAAEDGDDADGFDLSWLDDVEAGANARATAPAAQADAAVDTAPEPEQGSADDDIAFLEELDRAIAANADQKRPGAPAADPDRTLDADRAGMLLCKECGAINEPQLWYCEICGSEL